MTTFTTSYDSGDVILVRVVFTDLSGAKVRPAVVLSTRSYSKRFGDLVVMPLTSQSQPDAQLALKHWKNAGLLGPGWVKPLIASVASPDVVRALGRLDPADVAVVRYAIRTIVDPQWLV